MCAARQSENVRKWQVFVHSVRAVVLALSPLAFVVGVSDRTRHVALRPHYWACARPPACVIAALKLVIAAAVRRKRRPRLQ
jgi:hypothetical protein